MGELLWRLDQRVLPPLARAIVRLGRGPARPHLLTGAALISVTAVLVAAVWATDQRRNPAAEPTIGALVEVGVAPGQSVPGYVASSRTELSRLVDAPPTASPGGETYALVTLSAYLPPDRLAAILDGGSVSAVYARVPLPGAQTSLERISAYRVPDDVVAGMRRLAGEKDRQAAEYRNRSDRLTGENAQDRLLRAVYADGARIAGREAAAYRTGCPCVYAAVVRATPAALDRIAHRRGVRAVDPAPEVRRLDRAVFLPPLPEQVGVVRTPADTPLDPTGTPSEAPPAEAATPSPEPSTEAVPTGEPSPASASLSAPPSEPTPEPTESPMVPGPSATSGP